MSVVVLETVHDIPLASIQLHAGAYNIPSSFFRKNQQDKALAEIFDVLTGEKINRVDNAGFIQVKSTQL